MKKLIGAGLTALVLTSSPAFADGKFDDMKFYFGGELQESRFRQSNDVKESIFNDLVKKGRRGLGLFAGVRAHENFGVEIGATKYQSTRLNNLAGEKIATQKAHNLYADAMGYLPMNENFELVGSLGLGRLNTKITKVDGLMTTAAQNDLIEKANKNKIGLRVGAGVQYKVENVGVRFMLRHQKGNSAVKSQNSAGLGIFYQV